MARCSKIMCTEHEQNVLLGNASLFHAHLNMMSENQNHSADTCGNLPPSLPTAARCAHMVSVNKAEIV